MNKRIDFTKSGGFPATQYTWAFVQDSFRGAFSALAGLIGDKTIVTGVVEAGGNVSDGWVCVGGELMPFLGGPIGANVLIEEIKDNRVFNDGINKEVYYTKRARFGNPGFPYSELSRPTTIKGAWQKNDVKMVQCDMAYLAANFQNDGLGISERLGWQICNGLRGTQNMGGRFPMGYDPTKADYDTLLDVVGKEFVTLTIPNLPSHNHTNNTPAGGPVDPGEAGLLKRGFGGANGSPGAVDSNNSVNEPKVNEPPVDIPYQGADEPFKIIPPAIITLFIAKL